MSSELVGRDSGDPLSHIARVHSAHWEFTWKTVEKLPSNSAHFTAFLSCEHCLQTVYSVDSTVGVSHSQVCVITP